MSWLVVYLLVSAVFVFGFHVGRTLGYSQGAARTLEVARVSAHSD